MPGLFEGLLVNRRIFALRCDRNRLGELEEPTQQRQLEDPVVHDETDRTRAGRHQQHRVNEADMVADQNRRPGGRDMFVAPQLEPVDDPRQHESDKTQEILGHQHEDVKGHHRIEQGGDQEYLGNREVRGQQRPSAHRADDHEQGVQDIVGRDDARPVAGLRAQLDQRIHRHAEQAGEQRQQRQVGHHAPMGWQGQEFAQAQRPGRRQAARSEVQVDGEQTHADRAQRHQADLDMALAQQLAEQRAGADADRKHHQQQRGDLFIAMQHILRE